MTIYERTNQPWDEDPAELLAEELLHEFSDHIETESAPLRHEGIGHLVDQPERRRNGVVFHDLVAMDSHDFEDLSIEELAMHVVSEDDLDNGLLEDFGLDGLAV